MSKRWNIKENKRIVSCKMPRDVREDIEMSGFYVSDIVKYSADESGVLELSHHTVFPMLRRRPNDTHASYQCDIPFVYLTVDGERAGEVVDEFSLDGTLRVRSHVGALDVERVCYPSCEHAATYEKITVTNGTGESVALGTSLPELVTAITSLIKGHGSLSLGNIIGANIFNLVLVSGAAITVSPFAIPEGATLFGNSASLVLDIPVMFAVMAIMTLPTIFRGKLARWQGISLLTIYVLYPVAQFVFVKAV